MSGYFKSLFIISVALLFSACTSNNDDSVGATTSGQEAASYAVSGLVVKGGVAGSTVTVHSLGADGVRGDVVATASTDGSGAFKLVDPISGPAEVVATGGSYKDEATGTTVDMTGKELSVILLNGAAKGSTVAVTPLTKIAASQTRQLIYLGSDLTAAVNKANEDVTYQFGIADLDITSVPPLDLSASSGGATALTDGIDLNSDAARYGLVILGLSQTAKDEGRPPEHVLDLVDNIATDMANSVLDEGDQLPYNDFPRSPGNTLCELGDAIDDFLGSGQNSSGVTPADVDHKTYPNGVDCGNIAAAAPPPVFQCTNIDVVSVTPGNGQVTVKWGDKDQAPGYDIRYDVGATNSSSPITTNISRGANTYVIPGLENGVEYCFGARMDGCSFGGQELCITPNGPDGGSCQQDCGDIAKAECVNDTSGACFYYTFMACATSDYGVETKRTVETNLVVYEEEDDINIESCGNNSCQFEYCVNNICGEEFFEGGMVEYDAFTSCMVSCVENNDAGAECEAPNVELWPYSDQEGDLACGVTITDGGANDSDGKVDGCIGVELNWTPDIPGIDEFYFNADYENNGLWGDYATTFDDDTTSWNPVRNCAEDACQGLPCEFTDNYKITAYTNFFSPASNECAITFNFPAPQVEEELSLWLSGANGELSCDSPITIVDDDVNDLTQSLSGAGNPLIKYDVLWNNLATETGYVMEYKAGACNSAIEFTTVEYAQDITGTWFENESLPGTTSTMCHRVRAVTPAGDIVSNTCEVTRVAPLDVILQQDQLG